jgi:hypoxanthine phosphoribosyltransferase
VDPFGMPSWLDGRRVLVVDEVANTADTLRIACGFVKAAFPAADV